MIINNTLGFLTFNDTDIKLNIFASEITPPETSIVDISTKIFINFIVQGVYGLFKCQIIKYEDTDDALLLDVLVTEKYCTDSVAHIVLPKDQNDAIYQFVVSAHNDYARNSEYTGIIDGVK